MPRDAIWNVLFHFVNEKLLSLWISILVLLLLCANVQCAERKDIFLMLIESLEYIDSYPGSMPAFKSFIDNS